MVDPHFLVTMAQGEKTRQTPKTQGKKKKQENGEKRKRKRKLRHGCSRTGFKFHYAY